ncbi:MAG TPA: NERD domain-containing protein [Thiobacillaceae bacterium]|nr:NERD domain-containing protein [Thiobacillaceae bacterium]
MAILLPSHHLKHVKMTPGERRFATRLLTKLEDDYHCWFNVPVGRKQLRPDFIVLHPGRGVLVLEVKDWKLATVRQVDRLTVELMTDRGVKTEPNPLEQARTYAIAIKEMLERDPFLVQQDAGRYKGHLLLPWGFGVVLTNITRKQFEDAQLDQAIPGDKVICSDEMTESGDSEDLQKRLWGMFNYHYGAVLTLAHVDRIRWHLFPEIRIEQGNLFEPPSETPDTTQAIAEVVPDIVRLMDLEQEKLARNLGMGHRIIHGVAGSGKTMILAYRCLYLAQAGLGKPILVLCYNKTLAAKLQELLTRKGAGNDVQIRHFHGWCKDMCNLYQLDLPPDDRPIYERQVAAVMAGVDAGRVPRAQYAALLIDEGHDFLPEWFKLVVQMIDPQTSSLLLLYDDAQSIYGDRRKFSWKSVGIEAAGRSNPEDELPKSCRSPRLRVFVHLRLPGRIRK